MVRWKACSKLFAGSLPLQHHSPEQHKNSAQSVLCFRTCTETPCKPKRSPLSEMTSPASATAVFSLLPVPSRIASNSALESASGPSDNSRSRGLSSGESCLMVYLRPCTWVFYIIQVTAIRFELSARCSLRRHAGFPLTLPVPRPAPRRSRDRSRDPWRQSAGSYAAPVGLRNTFSSHERQLLSRGLPARSLLLDHLDKPPPQALGVLQQAGEQTPHGGLCCLVVFAVDANLVHSVASPLWAAIVAVPPTIPRI